MVAEGIVTLDVDALKLGDLLLHHLAGVVEDGCYVHISLVGLLHDVDVRLAVEDCVRLLDAGVGDVPGGPPLAKPGLLTAVKTRIVGRSVGCAPDGC